MNHIDIDAAWKARAQLASYADLQATAAAWYMEWRTCPYCNSSDFDADEYEFSDETCWQTLHCNNCSCSISPNFKLFDVYAHDNAQDFAYHQEATCELLSTATSTSPASNTPSESPARSSTTATESSSPTAPSSIQPQPPCRACGDRIERSVHGSTEHWCPRCNFLLGVLSTQTPNATTDSKTPKRLVDCYEPTSFY